MPSDSRTDSTFRALLRFWRHQRGMSQLDLGLTADVSARHISFLETGRSRPSVEMVRLLGEVLDVPLHSRNELLRAAGFEAAYPEPTTDELLDGPLGAAIDALLDHGEPYPVVIIDRWYRLVRSNRGGRKLLALAGLDLDADPRPDLLSILFDPVRRPLFANWDELASEILRRLQRLALRDPSDDRLATLLSDLLATPGLPDDWRTPDLSDPSEPMVSMEVGTGEHRLRFLTTVTVFASPDNVTLEHLVIENYLPLDATTRSFFTDAESPDLADFRGAPTV